MQSTLSQVSSRNIQRTGSEELFIQGSKEEGFKLSDSEPSSVGLTSTQPITVKPLGQPLTLVSIEVRGEDVERPKEDPFIAQVRSPDHEVSAEELHASQESLLKLQSKMVEVPKGGYFGSAGISYGYMTDLKANIKTCHTHAKTLGEKLPGLISAHDDLSQPAGEVQKHIKQVSSALDNYKKALQAVKEERNWLLEHEDEVRDKKFPKEISALTELGTQLEQLEKELQTLEKAFTALKNAEGEESCASWREALGDLRQHAPDESIDNLIWLHQLEVALDGDTSQQAIEGALTKLVGAIPYGVVFPNAAKVVELLSQYYPVGSQKSKDDDPELRGLAGNARKVKHDELVVGLRKQVEGIHKEIDALDKAFSEDEIEAGEYTQQRAELLDDFQDVLSRCEQLVEREREAIQAERESALHYVQVMLKTSQAALDGLPKVVKATQQSYRDVLQRINETSVTLQRHYRDTELLLEGEERPQEVTGQDLVLLFAKRSIAIDIGVGKDYQRSIGGKYNDSDLRKVPGATSFIKYSETVDESIQQLALDCARAQCELDNFTSQYAMAPGLLGHSQVAGFKHGYARVNFYGSNEEGGLGDAVNTLQVVSALKHLGVDPSAPKTKTDSLDGANKLERAKKAQEYLDFLAERRDFVSAYKEKLDALIKALPEEHSGPLKNLHQQLSTELVAITNLVEAKGLDDLVSRLEGLQNERTQLQDHIKALGQQTAELEAGFTTRLKDANHRLYQLRSRGLQENIVRTRALVKGLEGVAEKLKLDKNTLEIEYKTQGLIGTGKRYANIDALLSDQSFSDRNPVLLRYRKLHTQQTKDQAALEVLRAQFGKDILNLQDVHRYAEAHGGFPNAVKDKVAETFDVFGWFTDQRKDPGTLLIEHNLAMRGVDMVGAYKELAGVLPDLLSNPTEGLKKLGFTPSQLQTWLANNPEEAMQLMGNLNHAYVALSATGQGVAGQLTDMIKTAWDVGTKKNMALDVLLGSRENIVSAQGEPPPAAFYALLSIGNASPYIANIIKSVKGENIGGTLAMTLTTALGGGAIVGTTLAAMCGVAQTKAEKGLSTALTANRDFEVFVNATLAGVDAVKKGGNPADFVKEFAKYETMRAGMKELGTIHADFREGGLAGTVKRYTQEVSTWWSEAGKVPFGRAKLVVSAVALPALVIGIAAASGVGLIPLAIIAVAAMLGGGVLMRAVWDTLCQLLGLGEVRDKVREQMHTKRMSDLKKTAAHRLNAALAKQVVVIKRAKLDEAGSKAEERASHVQLDQGALRQQAIDKTWDLIEKKLAEEPKLRELDDAAFVTLFNNTLQAISREAVDPTLVKKMAEQEFGKQMDNAVKKATQDLGKEKQHEALTQARLFRLEAGSLFEMASAAA